MMTVAASRHNTQGFGFNADYHGKDDRMMNDDTSYTLPNGIIICAQLSEDNQDSDLPGDWISIDLLAVHPDGFVETLCSAEYTRSDGKLLVTAHDEEHDDYVFETEYAFRDESSSDTEPAKTRFAFEVKETLTGEKTIEAPDLYSARKKLEAEYRSDWPEGCRINIEFIPHICRECARPTFDDEENDSARYVINEGFSDEYEICFGCHRDMMERGDHTQCESCHRYFTYSHLGPNTSTGETELCPYCGEIWCE